MITTFTIRDILNVIIILLLISVFIGIFIDSRKHGAKIISALEWALIGTFVFPPVGLAIYILYRNKGRL